MRILIIEDEKPLAEAVGQILKKAHFTVDIAFDGKEGYFNGATGIYDLIILDIMLPNMDGLTILKKLRADKITAPVLMLTAKSEVPDRVAGLDSGADDYLPKPFASEELLARIRALTRRKDQTLFTESITFGDLSLNTASLQLVREGKSVTLTAKEYELLQYMILRKGIITPKEMIIEKLWGYEGDAEDNNVEVYISFLRKKLSFLQSTISIKTIRGLGYSLGSIGDV